jgi:aminopeptidase YwaD
MNQVPKEQLEAWLWELCEDPAGRSVGTSANRKASDLFARIARECEAELVTEEFDCLDYEPGSVELNASGESFAAWASPFSLGCDLHATLLAASTFQELEGLDLRDKILLLHGELAGSQIMPKNFLFYNPEEHQKLVKQLEESGVAAIISATKKQPDLNAAVYPTPMFEDGDLDIPSVFLSEEEGRRLLPQVDQKIRLTSTARRIPARAWHILAAFGSRNSRKILICSHLDTKKGTPGALDNAGGTIVLMALLDLLRDYHGPWRIELMPFNGEDYYAVPSEMIYLRDFDPKKMELCLNLDGVGLKDTRTGICHFNLSREQEKRINSAFADTARYCATEPWIQGDHAIFAMQGVPAAAFCTQDMRRLFEDIAHTAKDTPALVDTAKLSGIATDLYKFITSYPVS